MMNPTVYIAVLNWNGFANTKTCIESLKTLEYSDFEIIIVDNASVDNSVQQIQTTFPELTLIQSDENLGYAGGNRLALEKAKQDDVDLFWILNNDTLVMPTTLTALVNAYQRQGMALYGSVTLESAESRRIGFGGGLELDADGNLQHSHQFNPLQGRIYDECFKDKRERKVDLLSGSSFMVPVALARDYGFMDETFFMYGEEQDYCQRLAKSGIPSILVPESLVVHKRAASFTIGSELTVVRTYYQARNKLVYTKRYGSPKWVRKQIRVRLQKTWRMQILSLLAPKKARNLNLTEYYEALGIRHAILNRTGKTVVPEDFLDLE